MRQPIREALERLLDFPGGHREREAHEAVALNGIEVDAGRTVDVVFTKGFSLEAESAGGSPDTYTDIWRRGREIQKKPLEPYQAN